MASFSLNIKYKPLRIGFCIKQGDINGLVEIAELNALLAGGAFNPIIPIGGDLELSEALVKLFGVDVLYAVSSEEKVQEFINKHDELKTFDLEGKFLWSNDYDGNNDLSQRRLRVLDVIRGLRQYSNRNHRKILNPQWEGDDPLATLFSLEYGTFPEGEHPYNLPIIFPTPFYEKPISISSKRSLDPTLIMNPVPMDLGLLGTTYWGNSVRWDSDGIYIGDHDKFEDLVSFWNLRAAGIDLQFIPFKFTEQYKVIAKLQVEHAKRQDSSRKFPNGVGCWYLDTVSEEMVNVVIHELGVDARDVRTRLRLSSMTWNGLNVHPYELIISNKTVMANVDQKYGSPRVSFELPDVPAPPGGGYHVAQHYKISVSPITEFEYEGYSLKLPFLRDLNNWYSRQIDYSPYDVRIELSDTAFIVNTHETVKTIGPIKHDLLIKQLFKRADIEANDSQPGLLARKLVEQMGGLEDCRVFKIPGVRKLIASLSATQLTDKGNATKIIYDKDAVTEIASFKNHEDLHIQARKSSKLTVNEVFSYMLSKKLFRAGLEMSCSHCNLKSWLPINSLNNEVVCEYCGGAVELITQLKDRGDWKFRKSGLIGSDNNQEGAIPVVLTLWQFSHMSHMGKFVYSTALKLSSNTLNIDCETDLAILGHERDIYGESYTAIAIGEVKSNADEISDRDIQNLTEVKEALDKSGLKTYLVFAKTADFTADEIKRFKALVANGINPILLTDKELDPYMFYDYYRKNGINLPRQHGSSFSDMAQNSVAIYLKQVA